MISLKYINIKELNGLLWNLLKPHIIVGIETAWIENSIICRTVYHFNIIMLCCSLARNYACTKNSFWFEENLSDDLNFICLLKKFELTSTLVSQKSRQSFNQKFWLLLGDVCFWGRQPFWKTFLHFDFIFEYE